MRSLAILVCVAGLGAAELASGLALKADGRLTAAEIAFRVAIWGDPYDADAVAQLATVVGWQGRHAEAEKLWRRAVLLRPGDADLRTGLARVRWWRGDADGAMNELAGVLHDHPGHADALALSRQVSTAPQRLFWRVDFAAMHEHFTEIYGDARSLTSGLGATWKGVGTVSGGATQRTFDRGTETTWRVGLGVPVGGSAAIELGGERTDDPVLAARAALTADASWRLATPLEPVFGWRRSWYTGDHIDLVRPGLRWYPLVGDWSEANVEVRALAARSPVSGVNGGAAMRLTAQHASGWAIAVGAAIADEAEPPNPPTRVITSSLGGSYMAAWWGIRLDLEHEDRRDEWDRTGLSLGGHLRW